MIFYKQNEYDAQKNMFTMNYSSAGIISIFITYMASVKNKVKIGSRSYLLLTTYKHAR